MKVQSTLITLACVLVSACVSAPSGPPEEIAASLIADLDAGRGDEAEERFESVESDDAYRERIYPILYEAAQERYERRDVAGSAALLRFMSGHYPSAPAVKEALLYCLFLERGMQAQAPPELIEEIATVSSDLRSSATDLPVWFDLIETQQAIDTGNPAKARQSLALFLERWDGEPRELMVYVEDFERYLRSSP